MSASIELRKEQGARLRRIRAEYGRTQKEMSAYLGLGDITWQTYERGLSSPKSEVYSMLERDGWNTRWVLTGKGGMKFASSEQAYDLNETSTPDFPGTRNVNARRLFDIIFDHISEADGNYGSRNSKELASRAFDLTEQVLAIAGSDTEAAKVLQTLLERDANDGREKK
jgi:transcriptional regulator with XRE-family HTH domain